MVTKTGWVSQFSLTTLMPYDPKLELVPDGPGVAGAYLLASRPATASIQSDGSFAVTVIPSEQVKPAVSYGLRLSWRESPTAKVRKRDLPDWRFVISNVNGPLLDDVQTGPPTGIEVHVGTENNTAFRFWYNPATADLRSNP